MMRVLGELPFDMPRGPISGEPGVLHEEYVGPVETAAILACCALITAGWVYAVGALFHWWRWL